MNNKLIIFDWDGTLMDSQAKIVNCMQTAAECCNLARPSDEAVKHIIGISLLPAIKMLFELSDTHKDEQLALRIRDAYKDIYLQQDQTPCPLFAGVDSMLKDLQQQGFKMAVATGKARRGLQRAWDNTGTEAYFIASRTADDAQSKPSSDMLEQLLDELNVPVQQAIMVGDTSYDIQMAKHLNMHSVAVTYGVHDVVQLQTQSPSFIVDSIAELHRLLTEPTHFG